MIERVVPLLIGLLGGIMVGFQSPIAGAMSQRIGAASGSVVVHIGGAIFSILLLLARGGENLAAWRSLPWYMLLSGGFGVVLFLTVTYTLPRLGAAAMLTLIVVGQLVVGVLIDHFGWFEVAARPLDLTRVIAIGFLLVGVYLIAR
ncbi:MAG: DMT family transporter [Anaerolineae bacterium]|nr:DMT family transporter [Anaerolineae bacterium]